MSAHTLDTHSALFGSSEIGKVTLDNRIALAPMTRTSATAEGNPTDRMGDYYRVFAEGGFGLLITEGLYIDQHASQGYLFQPGIATVAHAQAWAPIIARIHETGAKVLARLMHAGSQSQANPFTEVTLAPSAVRPKGEQLAAYGGSGPYREPTAMTAEDITAVRQAFVSAARLARDAGFDGVEIHGANGYLLDEFLTDYMNTRTGEYGGSVANRVRLAAEICADVVEAAGNDFAVGIRISQGKVSDYAHRWAGADDDAAVIFQTLGRTGIDFIHTTEHKALASAFGETGKSLAELAKEHGRVPVIVNGNLDDPADAAGLVDSGIADIVALGKAALANRNWPQRVRDGQPLAGDFPADVLGPLATIKDWETTTGPTLFGGTTPSA